MNDQVRDQLGLIVTQYGPGILQDPRRCRALLLDLCGEQRLEINLVAAALEEGVGARLAETGPGMPVQVVLAQQVTMLTQVRGLSSQAAQWAVETVALALGVTPADFRPPPKPVPAPASAAMPANACEPGRAPPFRPLSLTLAPGVVLELVRVPAGPFLMGSAGSDSEADGDEKPQHMVTLDEFYIGRYPVTVAQWAAFAQTTGYATTAEREGSAWIRSGSGWSVVEGADWQHPQGPGSAVDQKAGHPVTQVSWDDTVAFTTWASQVSGRVVRMPTEPEWEKAARGIDGCGYPWGNSRPEASRCNFNMNVKDTTPVGKYSPRGDSPFGAADMSGNVWEWTSSLYKSYPYRADDGREDAASRAPRVLRGGSFDSNTRSVRSVDRGNVDPVSCNADGGFRVAASAV